MRSAVIVVAAAFAACGHEAPFAAPSQDSLPPFSTALPRQLTFNPGDDRTPNVAGTTLTFSRLDASRGGRERCIAFMPVAGGTLARMACPPPPREPGDTFVDTWVEPVLSPDGRRIAFLWQKGPPAGYYTWTRDLVVAPTADPVHPTFTWQMRFVLPDGRIATDATKPMWIGPGTLRFIASYDSVFKVKGGGADRLTDTLIDAYTLVDLDLTTGVAQVVPGADSTIAYAPATGGGWWIVKSSDSTQLLLLPPGADTTSLVTTFAGPVVDLTNVAGLPVALLAAGYVQWVDPASGTYGFMSVENPIRRVGGVPGTGTFVTEIEKSNEPLSPLGANLWLFALPDSAAAAFSAPTGRDRRASGSTR